MQKPIVPIVDIKRRDLLKASLAASAAATVGMPLSASAAQTAAAADEGVTWHKGVCRFCGTGCGILVATRDGRVVATKGDPEAPVNKGLNCMKGYFNSKIIYGKDRLTQPLMRKKDGKFDKNGNFEPVSWEEALDEMARQFKRVYKEKGPEGVGIIGSGQYTIPESYTAMKLMKAGFRSNNIDPNARLCMASSVVGFYQTFGMDEPANHYGDIELTDTIVLWGNNMAEAHPVLWSRVLGARQKNPDMKVICLTTFRHNTAALSDDVIVFKPNTDLAILNYLIREIISRKAVDMDFVEKHCLFAAGVTDIGYGLRDTDQFARESEKDTLAKQLVNTIDKAEAVAQGRREGESVEQKNRGAGAGKHWAITFEEFKKGVEPYTLDFVAELAKGDPDESLSSFKKRLQALADLVCAKPRKLLSFWCMGFNQHQRGVWANELCYSMHLLLGKHGLPGSGAFSLTGQPSACGSTREVGSFSHRLPADRLVANPKHRAESEELWRLPQGTLNPKVGFDLMKMLRGLEDGSVNFIWTQVVNIFQSTPNNSHWIKAARKPENFVVVADVYPTFSAACADLILPAAMHFEKWGMYGNGERRTQAWPQMVKPTGDARTDVWMMLEFSKRFTIVECWGPVHVKGVEGDALPDVRAAARAMGLNGDATLFDVLFAPSETRQAVWPDPLYPNGLNATGDALGLPYLPEKALFNEYQRFTLGHGHDLADFDTYQRADVHGLLWPVVNGKETLWRYNTDTDPYAKADNLYYGPLMKAIPSGDLNGVTDSETKNYSGRAKIFFRPYAAPVEAPDEKYDMWFTTGRVLEHWHTGSMTRRVPELHRAVPRAFLYMHPADAKKRGLNRGDWALVESRYGSFKAKVETEGRDLPPRGTAFTPFFDETVMVNKVVVDAADPISLEPDYKKTAVRISKADA